MLWAGVPIENCSSGSFDSSLLSLKWVKCCTEFGLYHDVVSCDGYLHHHIGFNWCQTSGTFTNSHGETYLKAYIILQPPFCSVLLMGVESSPPKLPCRDHVSCMLGILQDSCVWLFLSENVRHTPLNMATGGFLYRARHFMFPLGDLSSALPLVLILPQPKTVCSVLWREKVQEECFHSVSR